MSGPATRTVADLADELFGKIERAQGMSFVSDGEHFPTVEQFFERVRGRLEWQRRGVRIMAAFLRKHGEYEAAR
jgi:hypothetical protein